jgi:hypothetical protein
MRLDTLASGASLRKYDWKIFAGICPRQQRRAGSQSLKKEDATQGVFVR